MCAITKSVTEGNTSHMTETTMTWENERTNKFNHLFTYNSVEPWAKEQSFFFSFKNSHDIYAANNYWLQFNQNPTLFAKSQKRKNYGTSEKLRNSSVQFPLIPFKEVWFSEASNKGFSAHSFHNITWAVDLHSFFLIHPTGVNSQQCYCFILKLSDFPVAWTMLRDIKRHQVRSHDIIKFHQRVHFLDKSFVHFS